MCGRARCTLRANDIARACHRSHGPLRTVNMDRYRPSYNVSPGWNLPVVRREEGVDGEGVVLHCMKWGLIPSFTKKTEKPDHFKMFNARSESICEKASFRRLVPKSRCLVAVEGFYEWKKDGSKKQPYYVHFKDGRPLLFAALYDSWENAEGEKLYTFTIITTSSSPALGWLHDRMPVILGDKDSTDTWLNGCSSSNFDSILKPYDGPDLVWYPVTPEMGKVSFDGPECIDEIQLKTEGNNTITKFFTPKGTNKEVHPKDTSSFDSSVKEDSPKSMKEEPASKEDREQPSLTEKCEREESSSLKNDLPKCVKEEPESKEDTKQPTLTESCEREEKCSASTFPQEGVSKGQTKRDYEAFSADSKPVTYKANKTPASPAKKKVNPKSSLDKQQTLFSYFGKS